MKKSGNSKKENRIKALFKVYPITFLLIIVSALLTCALIYYNYYIAIAGVVIIAVLCVAGLIIKDMDYRRLQGIVAALQKKFSAESKGELASFPMPVVLFDNTDKIIWYNNIFKRIFLKDKPDGVDVKQFTSGQGIDIIRENMFIECEYGDKKYTVFSGSTEYKKETVYSLYFVEDTELKNYRAAYDKSRPVVMIISLDGVEDSLRDFRESQQAGILGGVETIVENYFAKYNCISRKLGNNRFIALCEKESFAKMKEDKFSLLAAVRSYTYNGKAVGITLSIGAGTGKTLPECETSSRNALDMAMGRGGDQIAIKTDKNDFEFFGGVSKGVEKRTKVRTRMVASAIGEIIKTSSNVLIMGHRFADLDALGSAVGVALISNALGKDAKIVMSSKTTLAMPLAKHIMANGMDKLLVEPEDCDEYIDKRTLLVVVDTHRKSFLEYPELFDLVNTVVVIDHHRKTVDHINKAVIFYHEPNASSASEMVTELIQYIDVEVGVPKVCAEALMSGITLDTKNFVMKTGVRTFEAAAYLRSLGADTVKVKQLFSNSMKTQKDKSEVMKNAAMYENCAVGVVDFESDDVRIVASQAADELLNIDDVRASFVVFRTGDTINISARSYGELNVQLVMEELGGGGHQTMAAAQLQGETFENALSRLKKAIDSVKDNQ